MEESRACHGRWGWCCHRRGLGCPSEESVGGSQACLRCPLHLCLHRHRCCGPRALGHEGAWCERPPLVSMGLLWCCRTEGDLDAGVESRKRRVSWLLLLLLEAPLPYRRVRGGTGDDRHPSSSLLWWRYAPLQTHCLPLCWLAVGVRTLRARLLCCDQRHRSARCSLACRPDQQMKKQHTHLFQLVSSCLAPHLYYRRHHLALSVLLYPCRAGPSSSQELCRIRRCRRWQLRRSAADYSQQSGLLLLLISCIHGGLEQQELPALPWYPRCRPCCCCCSHRVAVWITSAACRGREATAVELVR